MRTSLYIIDRLVDKGGEESERERGEERERGDERDSQIHVRICYSIANTHFSIKFMGVCYRSKYSLKF